MIPQRGTYTVGNKKFEHKLPALQHATKTGEQVTWSFGDEYFSKFDWTREPSQSLKQLYTQRCQQLRDEYDYLVLFFSGGSDSHNILAHFIQAGIHIDEIITYHTVEYYETRKTKSLDRGAGELQNEWYHTVLPDFKNLANIIPNTKLTVFDYTDISLDLELPDNWLDICGDYIHPGAGNRINRYTFDATLSKIMENKSVGLVYGVDKPRAITVDGNWYMTFLDINASQPPLLPPELAGSGACVEFFYWSDQSVPILIKQGHLLRKFYESGAATVEAPSNRAIPRSVKDLHDDIIRSVVYPYWRPEVFQLNKPTSTFFNETDVWTLEESDKSNSVWREGFNHVINTVDPKFINFKDTGEPVSYAGFWSKWHQI